MCNAEVCYQSNFLFLNFINCVSRKLTRNEFEAADYNLEKCAIENIMQIIEDQSSLTFAIPSRIFFLLLLLLLYLIYQQIKKKTDLKHHFINF